MTSPTPRCPRTDPQPGDTYTLPTSGIVYTVRARDGADVLCERRYRGDPVSDTVSLSLAAWSKDDIVGTYVCGPASDETPDRALEAALALVRARGYTVTAPGGAS